MKIFVCALLSTLVAAIGCKILGLPPLIGHLHSDGLIIFVATYVGSAGTWDTVAARLRTRKLNSLIAQARALPTAPLTHAQRLDFAYGNLAASTRHKPNRDAFQKVAIDICMPEDDFIAWARDKEWQK